MVNTVNDFSQMEIIYIPDSEKYIREKLGKSSK